MKRKRLAALVALISFAVLLLACDSREPEGTDAPWNKKLTSFSTTWVDRYKTITFPPKGFAETRVFTHNLQALLVREDGRPVLFDGFLEDITKQGDQFYVHFTSRLSHQSSDERAVRFHLSCSHDDVRALLENPPEHETLARYLFLRDIRKDFLVVARVSEVERIMNHRVVGHSSEGSDKVDLEIQAPDTFSAQGELVNMVKYSEIAR